MIMPTNITRTTSIQYWTLTPKTSNPSISTCTTRSSTHTEG
jgi:hypothetical protein